MLRLAVLLGLAAMLPASAHASPAPITHVPALERQFAQSRATCKSVSSCREAVILWCNGYRRADGDNDGIPSETVCHSREQVVAIQKEIGCRY